MRGIKIYLRHKHDSGWRWRNWQIIIVQPSESNYASFSTVKDLSAFSVSLAIGQNWISNNIQWSLRLRYQRRWTGWQTLMIQELWLIFPPLYMMNPHDTSFGSWAWFLPAKRTAHSRRAGIALEWFVHYIQISQITTSSVQKWKQS